MVGSRIHPSIKASTFQLPTQRLLVASMLLSSKHCAITRLKVSQVYSIHLRGANLYLRGSLSNRIRITTKICLRLDLNHSTSAPNNNSPFSFESIESLRSIFFFTPSPITNSTLSTRDHQFDASANTSRSYTSSTGISTRTSPTLLPTTLFWSPHLDLYHAFSFDTISRLQNLKYPQFQGFNVMAPPGAPTFAYIEAQYLKHITDNPAPKRILAGTPTKDMKVPFMREIMSNGKYGGRNKECRVRPIMYTKASKLFGRAHLLAGISAKVVVVALYAYILECRGQETNAKAMKVHFCNLRTVGALRKDFDFLHSLLRKVTKPLPQSVIKKKGDNERKPGSKSSTTATPATNSVGNSKAKTIESARTGAIKPIAPTSTAVQSKTKAVEESDPVSPHSEAVKNKPVS